MTEFGSPATRPPLRSGQGQQSLSSRPLLQSSFSTHRRIASDSVTIDSQWQSHDTSRRSSISADSRRYAHPDAANLWKDSTLSSTGPWSEGGDLGTTSPHLPTVQDNGDHRFFNATGTGSYSPAQRKGSRPKPAPFQFDDSSATYSSPSGSSQSAFSPFGRFQHRRADSRTHLLDTPPTSTTWRTPRTPPPYTAALRTHRWWTWRPVWTMYLFFLLGIACAVGHHVFYSTLNGRPAHDQLSMLRYGAVLAFATKAALVASVLVAFKQRLWNTVRSKLLSLHALDSLFAATEDLSAMFNAEVYKRAKVAMLLAVFVWLTPLMIILTSNTLTVEPALRVDDTTCLGIRTLNFSKEEVEEWRYPTRIDSLVGTSVSLWNSTSTDIASPDWFDYYTGASDQFVQVATHAAFMQQPIPQTNANIEICGSGWNCTYVVNFAAPALKCMEVAEGAGSKVQSLGDQRPPDGFSTDLLLPRGSHSYYAYTGGGDYSPTQMNESDIGGMPTVPPPFPKHLGALRTEPVIWVGYAVIVRPDEKPPDNSSMPGWYDAFMPHVLACENHEAEYTVLFNLTGGQQIAKVTGRRFTKTVINTTWDQDVMANDGTQDNTTAHPEANYIYPRDLHAYRRAAAFHGIGSTLRYFLNGTTDSTNVGNPIVNTKAIQTKLLDPRHDNFVFPNLADRMQELYEDIILSLFSNHQFLVNVWASSPDVISGTLRGNSSTAYPCRRSRLENRYAYHVRDLWIVYGLAIMLSLGAIISGTLAVLQNEGVLRNTRFSSIVAATRGPALEKLGWGEAGDGRDVPRDVKNLRVGYGIVHRPSGLGVQQEDTRYPERSLWEVGDVRYGFGIEGNVRQVRSEASLFRQRL
ncbi:hypothetical protein F5Y15DRAFT_338359 [Xylariaceae sp. FL0016]|nr:hypothetical protein F5Y15DRAFT_338359 [Xylariaceae sp. FL0016]